MIASAIRCNKQAQLSCLLPCVLKVLGHALYLARFLSLAIALT